MFKRSSDKKFIRLIPQFALLLVTALTLTFGVIFYFNSSLGWFAANKEVDSNAMGVKSETIDAEAEYIVYIYNAKEARVEYTGDSYPTDDPEIDNLRMQVHDVIFRSRNRYTPAIVQIRLTNISEDYASGGVANVTLVRNNEPAYDSGGIKELLTSIMRFTLAQNKNWYDADADELYSNIDDALYSAVTNNTYTGSTGVFTTITTSGNTITGATKLNELTLSVPYAASDIVNGHLDLYLYITYDVTLVGHFESASGITGGTTVGSLIPFGNDLTAIRISLEEGN